MEEVGFKSKIAITSEKEVTVDFLVAEANLMWRKIRKDRRGQVTTQDHIDAIMRRMQSEHTAFCKSYPIVNRYMCQHDSYNQDAFKRWLVKIKSAPWKSRDEYLDAQADYCVLLYRSDKNNPVNKTVLTNLRQNIKNMLVHEYDEFESNTKKALETVDKQEAMMKKRNINELYEFADNLTLETLQPKLGFYVETDTDLETTDNIVQNVHAKISKLLDTVSNDTTDDELLADNLLA